MNASLRTKFFAAALVAVLWPFAAMRAEEIKLTVDGTERTALVFVPQAVKGKAPVVFAFHGHGGSSEKSAEDLAFQSEWPEAIVVYMQGLPGVASPYDPKGEQSGWQRAAGEVGDRDLKFFDAVLAELHKRYAVDDQRIYATGFSNGGFFVYLLWAERQKTFAAFAPCAAMIWPSIHLPGPAPVLVVAGTTDPIVQFEKQQAAIAEVKKVNGCAAAGKAIGTDVTYYPSSGKTPVVTFIHPGGHVWPRVATQIIVKFFKNHPGGG